MNPFYPWTALFYPMMSFACTNSLTVVHYILVSPHSQQYDDLSVIISSQLIDFTNDSSVAEWKGFMYASLFFVSAFINSILNNQVLYIGMTLGMRVRATMMAAVYKKVLPNSCLSVYDIFPFCDRIAWQIVILSTINRIPTKGQ